MSEQPRRGLRTLFAGNLAPDTTEIDLYEALSALAPNSIASMRVCRDLAGASLRYAYVNCCDSESAEKLLDAAQSTEVLGRPVRLAWKTTKGRESRNSAVAAGVPPEADEAAIRAAMEAAFGPVASVRLPVDSATGRPRGYAVVNFESPAGQAAALARGNEPVPLQPSGEVRMEAYRGTGASVAAPPTQPPAGDANLFVGNLAPDVTDERLLTALFADTIAARGASGRVCSCRIMLDAAGRSKGYGFVGLRGVEPGHEALIIEGINSATLRNRRLRCAHATRSGGGGGSGGGGTTPKMQPPPPTPLTRVRPRVMVPAAAAAAAAPWPLMSPVVGMPQGPMPPGPLMSPMPVPPPVPMAPPTPPMASDVPWADPAALEQAGDEGRKRAGELLHPLVRARQPWLANKITGMVLELSAGELLEALRRPEALDRLVGEAAAVVARHEPSAPREGEPFGLATLAALPDPVAQRVALWNSLLPRVARHRPADCAPLTHALLEQLDGSALLQLVRDDGLLAARVGELAAAAAAAFQGVDTRALAEAQVHRDRAAGVAATLRQARERLDADASGARADLRAAVNAALARAEAAAAPPLCVGCKERQRVAALAPCGHLGYCAACADGLESCGVCGAAVESHLVVEMVSGLV